MNCVRRSGFYPQGIKGNLDVLWCDYIVHRKKEGAQDGGLCCEISLAARAKRPPLVGGNKKRAIAARPSDARLHSRPFKRIVLRALDRFRSVIIYLFIFNLSFPPRPICINEWYYLPDFIKQIHVLNFLEWNNHIIIKPHYMNALFKRMNRIREIPVFFQRLPWKLLVFV